VDAFVFWTRDARPFFTALDELESRGFPSIFLVTLTGYPPPLEPDNPGVDDLVGAFQHLSERLGPERVIWRYDPILLSNVTSPAFHRENFAVLARALDGRTRRVVVSVVDLYAKTERRLNALRSSGLETVRDPFANGEVGDVLRFIAGEARAHGMEPVSCCEPAVGPFGLTPGACVDAGLLSRIFSLSLPEKKDPGQRPECRCAVSKDIGATDTCPRGCVYCYATRSFERAQERHTAHDPEAPELGATLRRD
jgi:hypothetical protein